MTIKQVIKDPSWLLERMSSQKVEGNDGPGFRHVRCPKMLWEDLVKVVEGLKVEEGRSALEQAESRVELANSVMKLPYIKATRNTETGQERFVARDDVVTCIHEYAKRAREGKV